MAIDLVTLARVKARLGVESSDTSNDAVLSQYITAVSRQVERYLDRHTEQAARTEVYELPPNRNVLLLRGVPVDTDESFTLKFSTYRSFMSSTSLASNDDYVIDASNGMVRLYINYTGYRDRVTGSLIHPAHAQVAYTGGMAADTATFATDYPDIAQAVEDQVRYIWQRQDSQGGSRTLHESSSTYTGEYGLLKDVRATLEHHRRRKW